MGVWMLDPEVPAFPPASLAEPDEDGLLAVGGDYSVERLLAAYRGGIFPWSTWRGMITWHSPDPRFVLLPGNFRVPHGVRRALKKGLFEITVDRAFGEVIGECAKAKRPDGEGTWISGALKKGYLALHRAGWAHSAETWMEGKLVGGLYGVGIGRCFFGESMFHAVPDASHCAFAVLAEMLFKGGCAFVDAQTPSEHMARFGAAVMPRGEYLERLERALGEGGEIDWKGLAGG